MNIIFIGDVVGAAGMRIIESKLWGLRKFYSADIVICNGENASVGNGLLPSEADRLVSAGVDVITGGNHIFSRRELHERLDLCQNVLRPANYPHAAVGTGEYIFRGEKCDVLVLNLGGKTFMDGTDNPFHKADELLKKPSLPAVKVVDFHAETTSEKRTMGFYLGGRVTAVIGTHTHVTTADEEIIDGQTAYITDIGMTGDLNSVIGVKKEIIIERFLSSMPQRHFQAEGEATLNFALIEADEKTGKALSITRISVKE